MRRPFSVECLGSLSVRILKILGTFWHSSLLVESCLHLERDVVAVGLIDEHTVRLMIFVDLGYHGISDITDH